jgi:MFS family permease
MISNALSARLRSRARNGPLDWLNFLLADVQGGPFLAIYLTTSRNWDPGSAGLMLTVGGLATVAASTPLGGLVDRVRWKRAIVVAGAAAVGLAAITEALFPWAVAGRSCAARQRCRGRRVPARHRRAEPRPGRTHGIYRAGRAVSGFRTILTCRPLLLFTASITLFHFANAAMLSLAGERRRRHALDDQLHRGGAVRHDRGLAGGWAQGR